MDDTTLPDLRKLMLVQEVLEEVERHLKAHFGTEDLANVPEPEVWAEIERYSRNRVTN